MSSSRTPCLRSLARPAAVILVTGAALALGGCVFESRTHLSRHFGEMADQALVAQIADPDAHYTGDPAPGSDGARTAGAQDRYRAGKVTQPVPATAGPIGTSSASSPSRQ